MSKPELPEQAERIAEDQRSRFNELVDVFDTPQPLEVMARLEEIVAAACLSPGEVVLDVGTGVGVLIPLIEKYHPSAISACDVAEKMLERLTQKHPAVRTYRADIALLALASECVDVIFMNAMYGNIADKPRACRNAARINVLRSRDLRNAIEHFDEKLDQYLADGIVGNIFPQYLGPLPRRDGVPSHIFRAYYTDIALFELLGKQYQIKPVADEIERLQVH